MKTNIKTTRVIAALFAATLTTGIYAAGGNPGGANGTAKPPAKGAIGPYNVISLPDPASTTTTHGFDMTGFLQDAIVDPNGCSGKATLNGFTITVPCGMIIQMPANTLTWADMVNGVVNGTKMVNPPSLTLKGLAYPSFEMHIVGNTVNVNGTNTNIAGLMYISQQSLNSGSGVITAIDYSTGNLKVDTGDPKNPVTVQINDPNGRFGRAQSPDPRFSVDDANPTIHAATGYPMCIPRSDPNAKDAKGKLLPEDSLCPQKNRPLTGSCRNFNQAGITPPTSGELTIFATGQTYCSQYVMKAPATTPASALFTPSKGGKTPANIVTSATDPDVRQQAPFEIGDFITFSGTLMPTGYISAHTIEANIGIYTQPYTQPSYLAIGQFGVGTADPTLIAINGVAQETQNRIFLEASTTDVKTPVDIYMVDVDITTDSKGNKVATQHNRWISMYEMTGECDPAALTPDCLGLSGGITTQNTGPQPNRVRIRATKAVVGILSQPSRNIRVMARSLCNRDNGVPVSASTTTTTPPSVPLDLDASTGWSANLDTCFNAKVSAVTTADPTKNNNNANGLVAGQYAAPVFEYIFPENVKPGDLVVPNDFWHLPFLVFGDDLVGPLNPTPW